MKILAITNNIESNTFYLRTGRYKSFLAQYGIEMDVLQLSDKKTVRLKQYTRARQYNIVILSGVILSSLELSILNKLSNVIISDISGETIGNSLLKDNIEKFAGQMKMSRLVIASNAFLSELAFQYASDVLTLPTAVEIKRYRPMTDRAYDSNIRLLWIGDHTTLHYLINIAPVLEEIGIRYSEVVLRVISDKYFKLRNMPVEPVKYKLEYIYNALNDCDIGLAPLREGKYSRMLCGHNILQMQAGKLPVIASPVGTYGDMVMHEVNGLLAQNTDQWTNSLSLLIENLGIGTQYGTSGREIARERFSTSTIAQQLLEVLNELKK